MSTPTEKTVFLSTNEYMQLYLIGHRIDSKNTKEFRFSVTVNCTVITDKKYARNFPLNLMIGFQKNGNGVTVQVDMLSLPDVAPSDLKNIIDKLQSSPAFAQLMLALFNLIIHNDNPQEREEAKLLKSMFVEHFPRGVTSFTTSTAAKKLYWIYEKDHLVRDVSPFAIDENGGHVAFTVTAGFSNDVFMQNYDVECMMHLFNEGDKLGYYFELYLDEDNFHHVRLYDELPDLFMRNKKFLNRILQLMNQCNPDGFDDYLQDLILKFRASI